MSQRHLVARREPWSSWEARGRPYMPGRGEIRRLCESQYDALVRAAKHGQNPDQVGLDQLDQVKAYAHQLGPIEGDLFLQMWAEESQAIATHSLRQSALRDLSAQQGGRLALLLLVGLPILYFSCH